MSTAYKIVKNKESGNFELIENATEHVICVGKEHSQVASVYREIKKLNTGFEGWTPAFFLLRSV